MVTNNMKISTKHAAGTTPVNKPVAKKAAAKTSSKKFYSANAMPTPIKATVQAVVKKTKAIPEKQTRTRIKKNAVTPEERCHMIATAAYFRAEQRGFIDGHEMEDWICSELEIDAKLNC